MPDGSSGRLAGFVIVVSLVLVIGVVASRELLQDEMPVFRKISVPAGLLDYGEKGKVLKHLGLVYSVPDEVVEDEPAGVRSDSPGANLFRRKRSAGRGSYVANPGNVNQLPSTLAVYGDGLVTESPVFSVSVPARDPVEATPGIPINTDIEAEERRGTVSYFDAGELQFAANAGIRFHPPEAAGQGRSGVARPDFTVYFRYRHGARAIPEGVMFGSGRVRRVDVLQDPGFSNRLALDVLHRLKLPAPDAISAVFYLNGENMGVRTIAERVTPAQWAVRKEHDNFLFYEYDRDSSEESRAEFTKLWRDFLDIRDPHDFESWKSRIDITNLTRNVLALMFLGSGDWYREAAVLDLQTEPVAWRWISSRVDTAFGLDTPGSSVPSLGVVVDADAQSLRWTPVTRNPRSIVFAYLLNHDRAYRSFFLRSLTEVLNHELNPRFVAQRIGHYERLAEAFGESVPQYDLDLLAAIGGALRHRSDVVIEDVQSQFEKVGERLTTHIVHFHGTHPQGLYEIDGYPSPVPYRGIYFDGQEVQIRLLGDDTDQIWSVNEDRVSSPVLTLPVNSDLRIALETD